MIAYEHCANLNDRGFLGDPCGSLSVLYGLSFVLYR